MEVRPEGLGGVSGAQQPPVTSPPHPPSMRMTFSPDGTAVYRPMPSASVGAVNAEAGDGTQATATAAAAEPLKRKQGRPRKYRPDESIGSPKAVTGSESTAAVTGSGGGRGIGGFSVSGSASLVSPLGSSADRTVAKKKGKGGRPPGSGKKMQLDALGSGGIGFTPHAITIKTGEDVSSKIMSFSQNGSRAVCILSANGAISNVTLRQTATSGGTVTYEGRFEILSLSGSFLLSEIGGQRIRTGGLSVSLAGPDGRLLGGGVAGLLTASIPCTAMEAESFQRLRLIEFCPFLGTQSSPIWEIHSKPLQPKASSPDCFLLTSPISTSKGNSGAGVIGTTLMAVKLLCLVVVRTKV